MVEVGPGAAVQVLPRVDDPLARLRRPPGGGERLCLVRPPLVVPPGRLVRGDPDRLGVHVGVGGAELDALVGGEGPPELFAGDGVVDGPREGTRAHPGLESGEGGTGEGEDRRVRFRPVPQALPAYAIENQPSRRPGRGRLHRFDGDARRARVHEPQGPSGVRHQHQGGVAQPGHPGHGPVQRPVRQVYAAPVRERARRHRRTVAQPRRQALALLGRTVRGDREQPVRAGRRERDLGGRPALLLQKEDEAEQSDVLDGGGQTRRAQLLPQCGVRTRPGGRQPLVRGQIAEDPRGQSLCGRLFLARGEVHLNRFRSPGRPAVRVRGPPRGTPGARACRRGPGRTAHRSRC